MEKAIISLLPFREMVKKVVLLMFYDLRKPLKLKFYEKERLRNLNRKHRMCSKA